MSDQPWMKFYPSDWRSDPALRICSLAARGLWIEMLGLMHEADPRGHLLIKSMAPTDAQLAVLVGTTPDQIPDLIGELESAAVFSRTQKGVIYSRRMTKDEKKSRTARKNGKNGGNPTLRNKTTNSVLDNQQDKGQDKTQRPEARGHIPESRNQKESEYEFFGKVVRLNKADFEKWQKTYFAIPDLRAELLSLDAFYAENLEPKQRKDWFYRASQVMNKKHQDYLGRHRPIEPIREIGGV